LERTSSTASRMASGRLVVGLCVFFANETLVLCGYFRGRERPLSPVVAKGGRLRAHGDLREEREAEERRGEARSDSQGERYRFFRRGLRKQRLKGRFFRDLHLLSRPRSAAPTEVPACSPRAYATTTYSCRTSNRSLRCLTAGHRWPFLPLLPRLSPNKPPAAAADRKKLHDSSAPRSTPTPPTTQATSSASYR